MEAQDNARENRKLNQIMKTKDARIDNLETKYDIVCVSGAHTEPVFILRLAGKMMITWYYSRVGRCERAQDKVYSRVGRCE